MARTYSLISTATYIPLSPNEVIIKGSAFEGFTLLVEDPERRDIAASIIQFLRKEARTPKEVAECLGNGTDASSCEDLLESMRKAGAISGFTSVSSDTDYESIWSAFIRYGDLPDVSLLRTVTIASSNDVESLISGAREWGVPIEIADPEQLVFGDFTVAPPMDAESSSQLRVRRDPKPLVYLDVGSERAAMYRFNEQAVAAGVSVLYVRLDGVEYAVGPYVIPGSTPCMWEVERSWARSSADREQYETMLRHRVSRDWKGVNPVGRSGISIPLAVSLLELSLRGTCNLAGFVTHGRITTLKVSRHSVMRLPRCPVCLPMQPLSRNPLY